MPPDPRFLRTTAVNDPEWVWSRAAYDHLLRLNREAPAAFEAERRRMLDDVIQQSGSNADRLRRLQWRIDQERRHAHTPLQSCLRLQALMWACFQDLDAALQDFADGPTCSAPDRERANMISPVLQFPLSGRRQPFAATPPVVVDKQEQPADH